MGRTIPKHGALLPNVLGIGWKEKAVWGAHSHACSALLEQVQLFSFVRLFAVNTVCGHQSPDRPSIIECGRRPGISKGLSSLQLGLRLLWCLSIAQTHQHVFEAGPSTTHLLPNPLKKPHDLGGIHLSRDPSARDWSGSGLQDSITEHKPVAVSFFFVTETASHK